jgi:hypothetical protein
MPKDKNGEPIASGDIVTISFVVKSVSKDGNVILSSEERIVSDHGGHLGLCCKANRVALLLRARGGVDANEVRGD